MNWIKKLFRLTCICLALWFFFFVFTPFIEPKIPAWHRFNQIQEEQNLNSGAIYYSDVPQTQAAEEAMREAIAKAMQTRRDNALRKKQEESGN